MGAPAHLGIVVDSREQLPYKWPDQVVETIKLDVGDYSGIHVLDRLRIERKTLEDFLGCVGSGRQRFERMLEAMTIYPQRYLLLECTLQQLSAGGWKYTKVAPRSAVGSLFGWSLKYGVQPLLVGDRPHGLATVRKLVELSTKRALDEKKEGAPVGR